MQRTQPLFCLSQTLRVKLHRGSKTRRFSLRFVELDQRRTQQFAHVVRSRASHPLIVGELHQFGELVALGFTPGIDVIRAVDDERRIGQQLVLCLE